MEKYYVYMFTNKINGMSYIGQSINPEKRYKEHLYGRKSKKDTYFDKALKKYGDINFEYKIIDSALSQEQIDKLEQFYIKKYNTLKPFGYNILKGGRNQRGAWNSKIIDEYDLDGNYINSYESASYYENFINSEYKRKGINDSCSKKIKYKDRQFRYSNDEKPNKYIKPLPNHRTKVYQFDLDGNFIKTYNSLEEASKKTNTSRTSISNCIKGNYKTANNYIWSKEKKINIKNPKVISRTNIYKCDENKQIIEMYLNTKEAERKNNFKYNSYKMILRYLDTDKLYNGFYWYKVKTYKDNIVPSLEIGRCND